MELYFENSRGERRLIAKPKTEEDANKVIHKFCEDRHFKIYYIRTWKDKEGLQWYDVGSHTGFFILKW